MTYEELKIETVTQLRKLADAVENDEEVVCEYNSNAELYYKGIKYRYKVYLRDFRFKQDTNTRCTLEWENDLERFKECD